MKLFISYAKVNKKLVDKLVAVLREGGHEPWYDTGLMPGQVWKDELLKQITACDQFVYALTPESVASEWCQWEFAQAVEIGKPVMPVLLKSTKVPDSLARFHYADFTGGLTAGATAKLMGGIGKLGVIVPKEAVSTAPSEPQGLPAQAEIGGEPSWETAVLGLVLIGVNFGLGQLNSAMGGPLYFDTTGTVLMAALVGPVGGALVGAVTNLVSGLLTSNPTYMLFGIVSAMVGILAGVLWRQKWARQLHWWLLAGALAGALIIASSGPILFTIDYIDNPRFLSFGSQFVQDYMRDYYANPALWQTSILDRVLIFLVAWLVVRFLPESLKSRFSGR